MKQSNAFLLLLFSLFFVYHSQAQTDFKLKAELGVNRYNISPPLLNSEFLSGGVGWNLGAIAALERSRFYAESGLELRRINILISENGSLTQTFVAKSTAINIPLVVGTSILDKDRNITPLIEGGINLGFPITFNTERPDVLIKSDLTSFHATFVVGVGIKINRIELMFTHNADLNDYIQVVNTSGNYSGLKIAFRI